MRATAGGSECPKRQRLGDRLHVYGSHNDVTQAADLLTTGAYGTGIRLEGTGNVLRIASDTVISADGEEGLGILVSYGKDHRIEHRGTVTALGSKGVAARFDFGSNILGDGIEKRGSYISVLDPDYSYGTPEERLAQSGLDGALVKNFDVAGTLVGGFASIYVGESASWSASTCFKAQAFPATSSPIGIRTPKTLRSRRRESGRLRHDAQLRGEARLGGRDDGRLRGRRGLFPPLRRPHLRRME